MVAKQLRTVLEPFEVCAVASNTDARAEFRDRETYYAELRFAVHCQSRSIPTPRAALDVEASREHGRTEGESWDEMIARFDDTWT